MAAGKNVWYTFVERVLDMRIYKCKNYYEVSRKAANIISAQIIIKPAAVVGLATGSTPVGAYEQLVRWYNKGDLDFSELTTVNLDEYCGISPENEQSYRYFMNHNLFDHVNIRKDHTFVPDGLAADAEQECKRYEARIEALGGIDLQLLGIGGNGHVGFNEPGTAFETMTHTIELKESTRQANARFFNSIDEVPTHAITMGLKSIMQAKKILLVANGKKKAEIVEKALYGPVTPEVPASILQLHPDLTVVYTDSDE